MQDLKDLEKLLLKASKDIPEKSLKIIAVEGTNFIKKNFRDEGFNTGSGVHKWKDRKTTDRQGRDITRYRTNRTITRGSTKFKAFGRNFSFGGKTVQAKAGTLNKYGKSIQDRALLVGHKTGGDKLTNSFRTYQRGRYTIVFRTYKKYAQRHNEGLNGMPKRQFMGRSGYLDKRIYNKIKKEHDKRFG